MQEDVDAAVHAIVPGLVTRLPAAVDSSEHGFVPCATSGDAMTYEGSIVLEPSGTEQEAAGQLQVVAAELERAGFEVTDRSELNPTARKGGLRANLALPGATDVVSTIGLTVVTHACEPLGAEDVAWAEKAGTTSYDYLTN
jgi:hypothetical protein